MHRILLFSRHGGSTFIYRNKGKPFHHVFSSKVNPQPDHILTPPGFNIHRNLPHPSLRGIPQQQAIDSKLANFTQNTKMTKAAQLQQELQKLMDPEEDTPKSTQTKSFTLSHPSQKSALNIFAAFSCVLLAYQLVILRKEQETLLKEKKKSEEWKDRMGVLGTEDFRGKVWTKMEEFLLQQNHRPRSSISENRTLWGRASTNWTKEHYSTLHTIVDMALERTLKDEMGELWTTEKEREVQHLEGLLKDNNQEKTKFPAVRSQENTDIGELKELMVVRPMEGDEGLEWNNSKSGNGNTLEPPTTLMKKLRGFI